MPVDAKSHHDVERGHPYRNAMASGRLAKPGTKCPHGHSHIGPRCAWLAAHYDAHGYAAWLSAITVNDTEVKQL